MLSHQYGVDAHQSSAYTCCAETLMCLQQRFAEGLATHLTSGADLHSCQYDDLLAGLPAHPAMAGLLAPLVLPADAYQVPTHLQSFPVEQDQHQQSISQPAVHVNQMQNHPAGLETLSGVSMQATPAAPTDQPGQHSANAPQCGYLADMPPPELTRAQAAPIIDHTLAISHTQGYSACL